MIERPATNVDVEFEPVHVHAQIAGATDDTATGRYQGSYENNSDAASRFSSTLTRTFRALS